MEGKEKETFWQGALSFLSSYPIVTFDCVIEENP